MDDKVPDDLDFEDFTLPSMKSEKNDSLLFNVNVIQNDKIDAVPDDLEFNDPVDSSLTFNENVLKLVDPPEKDSFVSINVGFQEHDNADKNEIGDDLSEDLLNLKEPPIAERYDNKWSIEIQKLSESLNDPIVIGDVDIQKIETEDEVSVEKSKEKSDKSQNIDNQSLGLLNLVESPTLATKNDTLLSESLDDPAVIKDFEDEVSAENSKDKFSDEVEEKSNEIVELTDESSDDVKQELDDIVYQEEMRLASLEDYSLSIKNNNDEKELHNEMQYTEVAHGDIMTMSDMVQEIKVDVLETGVTEIEESKKTEIFDEYELKANDIILDSINKDISKDNEYHDEAVVDDNIYAGDNKDCLESFAGTDLRSIDEVYLNFNAKLKDIINWTHPFSSAFVFSILMLVELGLMWDYSIISLLAYSGLALLIANLCYNVTVKYQFIQIPSSTNSCVKFNKEDVKHCVDVITDWVDFLHKEIKSIAYMDSFKKNAKIFGILLILTYVGQIFNLQSLIFIGSLLLFSLPVVYNKFQSEIDEATMNGRTQLCDVINKVKSKLPMVAK